MKKHPVLKVLIILLVIIILAPCIYIAYDRSQLPPPPPWVSPPITPGQTWDQIANNYLSAHPDNALKNYLSAFSLMSVEYKNKDIKSIDTVLNTGWSKESPWMEQLMEINQRSLQEIRTGAEMNRCELPPTTYDFAAQVPNFLRIQTLTKLMAVWGKKMEYQKQPGEALRIYLDGMQFAKDFGQKDQSMISKLISIAAMSIHTKPILHLISQNILSEQNYRKIIEELGRIDSEKCTISAMIDIERRISFTSMYKLTGDPKAFKEIFGTSPSGKPGINGILLYLTLNRGKVLRNKLNIDNEYITASTTKTYREFVQTDWNKKLIKLDMVNRMSVPSYTQAYTRLMTLTSRLRLAQIQSAIHLYYLKNRKWPTDLKDLEPDYIAKLPLDPFTDQPYHWGKEPSGQPFTYSTGADFKDDSAQINYDPTNGTMSAGDIRS